MNNGSALVLPPFPSNLSLLNGGHTPGRGLSNPNPIGRLLANHT
jgi:hypothetical protein